MTDNQQFGQGADLRSNLLARCQILAYTLSDIAQAHGDFFVEPKDRLIILHSDGERTGVSVQGAGLDEPSDVIAYLLSTTLQMAHERGITPRQVMELVEEYVERYGDAPPDIRNRLTDRS